MGSPGATWDLRSWVRGKNSPSAIFSVTAGSAGARHVPSCESPRLGPYTAAFRTRNRNRGRGLYCWTPICHFIIWIFFFPFVTYLSMFTQWGKSTSSGSNWPNLLIILYPLNTHQFLLGRDSFSLIRSHSYSYNRCQDCHIFKYR